MTEVAEIVAIGAEHLHRSPLLQSIPGIVHGVTRRVAGAGLADGNVGYSAPRDRTDAWAMRRAWLDAAGLDAGRAVGLHQEHGARVVVVSAAEAGKGAWPGSKPVAQADALVTAEPGVVLMTLHADCMPILLCDPVKRVVATAHAGWRGTAAGVATATVQTMVDGFGCDPGDLVAHLGPAIGGCCYEVGEDVAIAWRDCLAGENGALMPTGDRWRFDLALANRLLLERAGVRPERIDESGICTMCDGEGWFSHRGQGPDTGRYAAFITIADGRAGNDR